MIYAMNHEEVLFYQAFSIQISCLIDQRIVTLGSKLNYFSIYWLRNKFSVSIEHFDKSRIIEVCESCDIVLPKILNQNNTAAE